MKKKVFTMMMARAAMTLLALFCFHGGANAQKTLPYEYDFENCWVSTLEADGWSKVDCDENSGIYAAGSLEGQGQLQFVFEPNNEHEQYLISPELESSAAIKVTFYYQSLNNGKKATFEVGYSTTTSDISAFTWSEEVSANYGWKQYMNEIPAGSKFVAIKYTSTNEDCQLCLDGFSFVKAPGHYGTWMVSYGSDYMDVVNVLRDRLGLELTEAKELANSAPCYVLTDVYEEEAKTLATWLTAKGAMAYAKDMRKHEGYATWLESCGDSYLAVVKTLKDLLNISLKEAKELADAAPGIVLDDVSEEEAQALANALNASGATAYVKDLNGKSYSLPYTYSFENNDLDGAGWKLKNCNEYTGIYNNENLADIYRSALEGDNCFLFAYNSNPPQYLISPLLEGTTGVAVSFYYVNYSNDYPETFQVGYSTTTNSPDAFIWNREVTAKDHNAWHQYKAAFPKGTKYVAVKYTSNDQYYLLLDDLCFEEAKPKPLPYTYGFENNDLEGEGWSLVDCDEDSEIYNNEVLSNVDCLAHEGDYCFAFNFNSNPPQYLISPKLEGTTGVAVSFYYKNISNFYPETFQVGYSTTTNSPDAFKWGNEVTANDNTTWKQYKAIFPEGTKYVAVKYTSNDMSNLFLDDFCFEEVKPTPLPYTYGFENNDLEGEGWSLVDCDEYTRINHISHDLGHEGDNCFLFHYNSNPPQYLISPQLEGTTSVAVSFYYKNIYDQFPETFQVGYSTTGKSPNDFTWGSEVTANDETTWKQYKATFPKGTMYVAVKLTSNNKYYLLLDDFSFTEATSILGDVNGDGLVDISDVVLLVNIILNDGNSGNQAADVNNDSHVDISDVVQLVNIILGS